MSPQCPRGHAVALGTPSVGACRVSLGGGGGSLCRFIPLTPPLGAGGWAGSWRACRPPGGALHMSRLNTSVPPAPRVCWLDSRARRGVCLGVHGMQTPFGWPWCPLLQQCLTPLCGNGHVGQEGFPCRSQTQDLVSRLRVSFFFWPITGRWWRENGCCWPATASVLHSAGRRRKNFVPLFG